MKHRKQRWLAPYLVAPSAVSLALLSASGCADPAASTEGSPGSAVPVGEAREAAGALCSGGVCTSAEVGLTIVRPLGPSGQILEGAAATAVFDTLLQAASPTAANGTTSGTMATGPSAGNAQRYSLIRFDLSGIPSGAGLAALNATQVNIINGYVSLTEGHNAPSAPATINVHQVTSSWTEATATWNNPPTFNATPVTSFSNAYPETTPYALPAIGIASLVQGWAQAPATNDGILLESSATSGSTNFLTSEIGNVSWQPTLTVLYTLTCGAGFADCNDSAADGCEVSIATDPNNCGACGNVCAAGDSCQAGVCTVNLCANVVCAPLDACHVAGACDTATGQCSNPAAANGTACPGGSCQNGVCAPACSPTLFSPRIDYPAGPVVLGVATADVNSDGHPDLVVAGFESVNVLLNNGDGTFAPQVNYLTGTGARAVAAGDLNGDGKPDLVTANVDDSDVSVLLNNGDGTFAPPVTYLAGFEPTAVALADLNGDGKLDLAVASSGVSVLLGNGDGTFGASVGYAVGDSPYSVVAVDLNGDGKPDLVTANLADGTVSVLLNNGDGTFASSVTYPVGHNPYAVVAADLNADGKPDLAVANSYDSTVGVLLNNGDGTFAPQVVYATGSSDRGVAAADLNGDGKPDLVTANYHGNTMSVLLNNGDGTFAAHTDYPMGNSPCAVAAADLDGNGTPDLAVANFLDATVSVTLTNSDVCPDFCAANPCQYGAPCVNGALGYACQCPSYATGTNCQNVPPCPCAGDPSWFIANSAPEAVCIVAYVTPTIYEYALANTSGGLAVVEPVGALCETSAVSATGLTPAQVQSCANSLLAMDAANGNLCAPCSAPTPACSNVCIDNPGGQYGGSSCN